MEGDNSEFVATEPSNGTEELETEEEPDLVLFAEIGDFDEVRRVLKDGGNINIRNQFGDTALHVSINYVKIVKFLLQQNANPNIQNNVGNTPLHQAALKGELQAVRELVKKGANRQIRNNRGCLPEDLARSDRVRGELIGEELDVAEIEIPKNKHGAVIGKKGARLQEYQESYGVNVSVPKQKDDSDTITLRGRKEAIDQVKKLIFDNIRADGQTPSVDTKNYPAFVKAPFPKDRHRVIIGSKGSTLRELEETYDVKIVVPDQRAPDNMVLVCGQSGDAVEKTIKHISLLLQSDPRGSGGGGRGNRGGRSNRGGNRNGRGGAGRSNGNNNSGSDWKANNYLPIKS